MHKVRITFMMEVLLILMVLGAVGLGLLVQFRLAPAAVVGGVQATESRLTWLGLDHHAWGTIQLAMIIVVLALVVAQLVINWEGYVRRYEEAVPNATVRAVLAPLGAMAGLLLLCLPLLGKPVVQDSALGMAPAALPTPTPAAAPPPAAPPTSTSVSPSESTVPVTVPPPAIVVSSKTTAVTKPRPKNITRVRRPPYPRPAYYRPLCSGKGYKRPLRSYRPRSSWAYVAFRRP